MGMSVGVRALVKFRRVVTVSGASEWQGQEGLLLNLDSILAVGWPYE